MIVFVPFKEAQDMNKLSLIMNGIAILIAVITVAVYFIVGRQPLHMGGTILSLVAMVPHEFLHALCFKGDVYMYENLKKAGVPAKLVYVKGGTHGGIDFYQPEVMDMVADFFKEQLK